MGAAASGLASTYGDIMKGMGASSRMFDLLERVPTMVDGALTPPVKVRHLLGDATMNCSGNSSSPTAYFSPLVSVFADIKIHLSIHLTKYIYRHIAKLIDVYCMYRVK